MRTIPLASAVTAVADCDEVIISNEAIRGIIGHYGVMQMKIAGTTTALIQGRINDGFDWVTIGTYNTSSSGEILLYPEMRVSVTVCEAVVGRVDCSIVVSER